MAEGGGMRPEQPREERHGAGDTTGQEQRGKKDGVGGGGGAPGQNSRGGMAGAEGGKALDRNSVNREGLGPAREGFPGGNSRGGSTVEANPARATLRQTVVRGPERLGS